MHTTILIGLKASIRFSPSKEYCRAACLFTVYERIYFCPSCYEHITRVPADPDKGMTTNEVPAYYKHLKDDNAPFCSLRCGPIQYKNMHLKRMQKAVEDEEIIVISGFSSLVLITIQDRF